MFDFLSTQALLASLLAQDPAPAGGPPALWKYLPWLAILAVMLVVMILPGKQQAKKRKAMMAGMSKNDRVLTRGGIIGVVMEVRDNEIILKVDESNNIRMHFAKQAIQHVFADKDDVNPSQLES